MSYHFRLADAAALSFDVMADVFTPPPPIDLERWASDNVVFGNESEFKGPYNPRLFPFFSRILAVLSPEHPCREVSLKKSAQIGGTILAMVFTGSYMDLSPRPLLYTHPTDGNAVRWSKTKWKKFLLGTSALRNVLVEERSRDGSRTNTYFERKDGRGELVVAGANSPAQLSMYTARAQVQDDLAKWEDNAAGDPEGQADSRSEGSPSAKIFKISTPLVSPGCRITSAHERGTQEQYHVPCPHCGHLHPLEWENFLRSLDVDDPKPEGAHFTCPACGGVIEERHRAWLVDPANGARWVAEYPEREPFSCSFYIWSAYSPLGSWQRLAKQWLDAKGDPEKEKNFLNDKVGLAYHIAGEAPPWEAIRNRANDFGHKLGTIPAGAILIAMAADCQGDRVEVHVKGFGRGLRRWTIDYRIIDGHISNERTQAALRAMRKETWPDEFGNRRGVDQFAIDAGNWMSDVLDFVKSLPSGEVMAVRGAKSEQAPELGQPRPAFVTKQGRRKRGGPKFWPVGVSSLKASFYKQLEKTDPLARGFCGYPSGLEDEFYRQMCAEKRVAVKNRRGAESWHWTKFYERNEVLDTEIYAEAAAIRIGWKRMTDEDWDRETAARERPNATRQLDLLEPNHAKAAPSGGNGEDPEEVPAPPPSPMPAPPRRRDPEQDQGESYL